MQHIIEQQLHKERKKYYKYRTDIYSLGGGGGEMARRGEKKVITLQKDCRISLRLDFNFSPSLRVIYYDKSEVTFIAFIGQKF